MEQIEQSHFFLHGLESSGKGTKGQYFSEHFPLMKCPDFSGSLEERLTQLEFMCENQNELILVGSSFGGLMACCFAEKNRQKVTRLILMAPALNFGEYTPPTKPLDIPVLIVIGRHDDITPMDPVLGLAARTFSDPITWICDDDHMLHNSFYQLDWKSLLDPTVLLSTLVPPEQM
ncbi:serine aminopeptidase domain-containing protein [Desulforhopalus sp. 52FAK]